MIKTTRKTTSRVLAALLALIMVIGMAPIGLVAQVLAETPEEVTDPSTFIVTVSKTGPGTVQIEGIDYSDPVPVIEGTNINYTITPDSNCEIISVFVGGVDVTVDDTNKAGFSGTITAIDADTEIAVEFAVITHAVTVNKTGPGTVQINGSDYTAPVEVNQGVDVGYTITPDTNYEIKSVSVGGDPITINNSNKSGLSGTIADVATDTILSVVFEAIKHTISVTVGESGQVLENEVSISGSITAVQGSDRTFSIIPANNYHVNSILVNNVEKISFLIPDDGTYKYTFADIQGNQTLTVTFEIDSYEVTLNVGKNGTANIVSGLTNGRVNHGDTIKIEIIPNDKYYIESIKDNNNIEYMLIEPEDAKAYIEIIIIETLTINITFKESETTVDLSLISIIPGTCHRYTTTTNIVYLFPKDTTVRISPITPYDRVKIDNEGRKDYSEYTKNTTIESIRVFKKYNFNSSYKIIDLSTTPLIIAFDTKNPTISNLVVEPVDTTPFYKKDNDDNWYDINWGTDGLWQAGEGEVKISATITDIAEDYNSGFADDGSGIYYTIVGDAIETKFPIVDGTFNVHPEVTTTYTIHAIDRAGNKSTKDVTVYVDNTYPNVESKPESITFSQVQNKGTLATVVNFLTFGAFFKPSMEVSVVVVEDQSGLNEKSAEIQLVKPDGTTIAYQTTDAKYSYSDVDKKYTFTFTISEDDLTEKHALPFTGSVQFAITDNIGNSQIYKASTANSNLINTDAIVMIEKDNPELSAIDIAAVNGAYNNTNVGGKNTFAGDSQFTVTASDAGSALYSVEILINGKQSYYKCFDNPDPEVDVRTETDTPVVTTEGLLADENGAFVVTANVVDNAGNTNTASTTVYKDTIYPDITSFDLAEIADQKYVESTAYGYYFKKDVTITVTAADDGILGTNYDNQFKSGVESITAYLKDIDGVIYGIAEQNAKALAGQETDIKAIEVVDNKLVFTIPANFKGQIFAKATDLVKNVTPVDRSPLGTIVESLEKHKDTSSIAIIPNEVAAGTENTTFSYSYEGTAQADKVMDYPAAEKVPLYANATGFTLDITDSFSGIAAIKWTLFERTKEPVVKTVTVDNAGVLSGDMAENWTKTMDKDADGKENNLVVRMQNTAINVDGNNNDMVLLIEITDRAGNSSYDYVVFGIDKIAPDIIVTYDGNKLDNLPVNGNYYKQVRIQTVTIYERNFTENIEKTVDGNIQTIAYTTLLPKEFYNAVPPEIVKENNNIKWEVEENAENPDRTKHTATIIYGSIEPKKEGRYTFELTCMDRAGRKTTDYTRLENGAVEAAAVKQTKDDFYVDLTDPYISISYKNYTQAPECFGFYQSDVTAEISVDEQNFRKEDVKLIGQTCTDVRTNTPLAFPDIQIAEFGTAKNDGTDNTRIANIYFSAEGKYDYEVTYTDLAGRTFTTALKPEFTIDKTPPECSLFSDPGAQNKELKMTTKTAFGPDKIIAPIIKFDDPNLCDIVNDQNQKYTNTYSLECLGKTITDQNGKEVVVKETAPEPTNKFGESRLNSSNRTDSLIVSWNDFEKKIKYDNVYILKAIARDKAGWESEPQEVMFSVNRFGAVYYYDKEAQKIINDQYVKAVNGDITAIEINAVEYDKNTVRVEMSDSETTLAKELINGTNYELKDNAETFRENKTWFQANYTIYKGNFAQNTEYKVFLSDTDLAGNNNKNNGISNAGEEGINEKPTLKFTVDNKEPVFEFDDLESTDYPVDEKIVTLTVTDLTLKEDSVNIELIHKDGVVTQVKAGSGKDTYSHIPGTKVWMVTIGRSEVWDSYDIRVTAKDKAGNEGKDGVDNFTVTKNLFVRWYRNTPLLIGSIAGVVIMGAAATTFIIMRKRRED